MENKTRVRKLLLLDRALFFSHRQEISFQTFCLFCTKKQCSANFWIEKEIFEI